MMFFMSSFHPKEAPISELLPCPECGEIKLLRTVEDCQLGDGLTIKKLRHYKCHSCGARFYDDAAMHHIQSVREKKVASTVE